MNSHEVLLTVLKQFPGVKSVSSTEILNRSAAESTHEFEITFDVDQNGLVARLLLDHINNRRKVKAELSWSKEKSRVRFRLTESEAKIVGRAYFYASESSVRQSDRKAKLTDVPILSLLSRVILRFKHDYDEIASAENGIALPVYLNVLRVLDTSGQTQQAICNAAILSKPAFIMIMRDLEKFGLCDERRDAANPRTRLYFLTRAGQEMSKLALKHIARVNSEWKTTFGTSLFERLNELLDALRDGYEIELPAYPVGYNNGDTSVNGGSFIPEEEGPPYIPCHGLHFPVEMRRNLGSKSDYSLISKLSQVFARFTLDYERFCRGGCGWTMNFLRHTTDNPIPLQNIRVHGITGNGLSGAERHLSLVCDPAQKRKRGEPKPDRFAYLTPRSRATRSEYEQTIFDVHQLWNSEMGSSSFDALHTLLSTISQDSEGLPGQRDFVPTTAWLHYPIRATHRAISPEDESYSNDFPGSSWHTGVTFEQLQKMVTD